MYSYNVQEVKVYSPVVDEAVFYFDLVWAHYDIPDLLGYNVYRAAASPTAEYVKLNDTPISVEFYRDDADLTKRNVYWYKVTAVSLSNDESDINKAVPTTLIWEADGWNTRMKYILLEFIRRHTLMLRADSELCTVYLKKNTGIRCSCYDERRGTPINSSCPICYGTSYVGGYEKYSNIWVRVYSEKEQITQDKLGLVVGYTPMIRVPGATPPFKQGDLVLRKNHTILHVERARHRHTQGVVTLITCDCTELEKGFPQYRMIGGIENG